MDHVLNDVDVRILGALIEKEITTPDYYPLSLHALTTACNQTSNRHPVVSYDEATVSSAVDRLRRASLVRGMQRSDSRVTKYQHLLAEAMNLAGRELAVMCVLMLRGPQTAGEIKTRATRLADFATLADVEDTLTSCIERLPSAVVRLPRQPGQKELRYAHLLSGDEAVEFIAPESDVADGVHASARDEVSESSARLEALEGAMSELRSEMSDLRKQLEDFRRQFE